MVKKALPPAYRRAAEGPLDVPAIGRLFTELANRNPELYLDTLQRMNDVGREVAATYGREASISLEDLRLPTVLRKHRADLQAKVAAIVQDPDLGEADKLKALEELGTGATDKATAEVYDKLLASGNSMAGQVQSGVRGNKVMLRQMVYGDMMMTDSLGRTMPYPGLRSYAEGISPLDCWVAAKSARKGIADTQLATGKVGYFGKQLTNVAHRAVVTMDDCGTAAGLAVDGSDPDNVGSVLLRDVGQLKAGAVIREQHLPALTGQKVLVRSPLGCRAPDGVCRRCTGIREHGDFPELGEAVGINAARSIAEAITQAALGSKHTGGVVGGKRTGMHGFPEINQFLEVPKEFVGGAVLAGADGQVAKVQPAPQGGSYIFVGRHRYHAPEEREVRVKPGDRVEAGDALTEGVPNPAALAVHKGIGEGRRYFLEELRRILDRNNSGTSRRNLELLARNFVSRVRITDPKGYGGSLLGDVVEYDTLASQWKPREGAGLKTPSTAGNLYLEQPYLHYTVGTRVTPQVARALTENRIGMVLAHPEPPPFEPVVTRAQDYLREDRDWIVRLGGENLEKGLLDAAERGASSERRSTSYYPALVNIGD